MSLIEVMQRLIDRSATTHEVYGKRGTACHLCSWARVYWDDESIEHSPDCPVPTLPRIVAALEAAELYSGMFVGGAAPSRARPGEWGQCWGCGILLPKHAPDCPWQALVAALRGEEVTA